MKNSDTYKFNAQSYGNFSSLIKDYLFENPKTRQLYHRFPKKEALLAQAGEKLEAYKHREVLVESLKNQLSFLNLTEKQKGNLEILARPNTVTVTTGHQLNLFSGPLYFFYKILQVIKCCEIMNKEQSEINFVPIFWMATEDHDFEEINHFYFHDQKFTWDRDARGAVGRLDLKGIHEVFEDFFEFLPDSENGRIIRSFVRHSYFNAKTLTEATQRLVQQFFGEYGLLMIDGDDKELKKLMIPAFREDLFKNTAYHLVGETNKKLLEENHKIQVNPREINLFYLGEGDIRERIVSHKDGFRVLNSTYEFSAEEIEKDLQENPDRYSPNVILRPLYQETILPNIAYVGGTGESAYWLQLKDYFDSQKILFPMVVVRNSMMVLSEKQKSKLDKLDVYYPDLVQPLYKIINENIASHSKVEIGFENYENQLQRIFDELEEKAKQTDVTFSNMVNAQRKKQLNGLEKMKRRLVKAEKRIYSDRVKRIKEVHKQLFPQNNLQERVANFSELYLEFGEQFIKKSYSEVEPVDYCFIVNVLS